MPYTVGSILCILLCLAGMGGCTPLQAPPALQVAPAVHVTYADPSGFSDAQTLGQHESNVQRREWIALLCQHLAQQAAPLLANDERLWVQILDVRRAGHWAAAPQAGSAPVRIVSEGEPPHIALEWRRMATDGAISHIGRRTLDSTGFMQRARHYAQDFLRYERALLDAWVEQELGRD